MPVMSMADVKGHLRVDGDAEDDLIAGLIAAAVDHVERITGLVLAPRTVVEVITGFGARFRSWPIVTIDAVAYVDRSGVDQNLAAGAFRLVASVRPGRLANIATPWPSLGRLNGAVTVTMTAGFADPADIPAGVILALKMIVGHFYRNREAVITAGMPIEVPLAVDALLEPHRPRAI